MPLLSRRCWSLGVICSSRRLTSKSSRQVPRQLTTPALCTRDSPTKLGRSGTPPIELLGRAGARTPEQQARQGRCSGHTKLPCCAARSYLGTWEERTLRHSRYLRVGTLTTTHWARSAVGHSAQRNSPRNSRVHKVHVGSGSNIARRKAGDLGPRLPLLFAVWGAGAVDSGSGLPFSKRHARQQR